MPFFHIFYTTRKMESDLDKNLMGNVKLIRILFFFALLCPTCIQCQSVGDLRLVDGGELGRGRVEIFYDSQWGTICSHGGRWDDENAEVVCRQLGFGTSKVTAYASTDPGAGPIHFTAFYCLGSEYRLLDACPFSPWISQTCDYAAVTCGTSEGDIRLVDGSTTNITIEGRVEIYHDGEWGTVCDDNWDDDDARAVCRQVGYSWRDVKARSGGTYGPGSGPVHLSHAGCVGTEHRLDNCSSRGWDNNNCDHSQDAGVVCTLPVEGDMQLAGGASPNEGRVEIFHDGSWGTVCDDDWNYFEAWAVCRGLGYKPYSGYAFKNAAFGEGSGPIHFRHLSCTGHEDKLSACSGYDKTSGFNCRHYEDAGVRCFSLSDGDIRLVERTSALNEGLVEMYHDGQWGAVCASNWDDSDAWVVCEQLGYKPYQGGNAISSDSYAQESSTIRLNDVACAGHETRLDACSNGGWSDLSCGESGYAGVHCFEPTERKDIRLVNGSTWNEGRLEIYFLDQWMTVCSGGYNLAKVVCRQLGFGAQYGDVPMRGAAYGQGYGGFYAGGYPHCSGDEASLDACGFSSSGSYCDHSQDVGVHCAIPQEGTLRLVNGSTSNQGLVQVYHNYEWRAICPDGWTNIEAKIACRQLLYNPDRSFAANGATYGPGSEPIRIYSTFCFGLESRLDACSSYGGNCNYGEAAGVHCFSDNEGEVELSYNGYSDAGVTIFHDDQWGTVCGDDTWDDLDATVVCRQLGYFRGMARSSGARPNSGPMYLGGIQCTGNESRLEDCNHNGWGNHNCSSNIYAEAECVVHPLPSSNSEYRLVGSTFENQGRVEIFYVGEWHRVCDNGWEDADAQVLCRQLGYSSQGAEAVGNSFFGRGSGPLLSDLIGCNGTEERLTDCFLDTYSGFVCQYTEGAAGVICGSSSQHGTSGWLLYFMSFTGVYLRWLLY